MLLGGSGSDTLYGDVVEDLASAGGDAVAFVPMRDWRSQRVDAVRGLGRSGLLCIDAIAAVAATTAEIAAT